MNTFFHTGKIGDIVAAIPTMRALGGGHLVIGNFTNPAWAAQRMEGARYEAIKPLLEAQPLIKSVRWSSSIPKGVTHDFSTFRHDHIPGESLAHWQSRHLGVKISTEPWLSGIVPRPGLQDRIIVARTARYQNWQFAWPQIVKEHRERLLFIGTPAEHQAFCKLLGPVEYLPTADMLEVAQVIAGSQLLISNQTAACWIGMGMGHALVQEESPVTRDSVVPRENAQFILYGEMPRIPKSAGIAIAKHMQQAKPLSTVSLTFVFPFHSGDKPQAQALAELIRDMGGAENHQCLMVYPDGTNPDGVEQPLREAFGSLEIHHYPPTLSGWPHGPNEMFAEVSKLIFRDSRFRDFAWLETDIVLTGPRSLDTIVGAYRSCGLPMLGVSTNTVRMDTRQVVGRHVVGVAVYPKNFAQLCPLVKAVTAMSDACRRQNVVPMAFDAYFGAYTVPRCSETRLIQHFWRSGEFREEGGRIIAGKVVSPGVESVVNPDAVLLHGCKDFSLLNIIRERLGLDSRRAPTVVVSSGPGDGIHTNGQAVVEYDQRNGPPAAAIATHDRELEIAQLAKTAESFRPQKGKLPIIPPEQWIRGEDGLPCPPFMKGQAEWERERELKIARLQNGGFRQLRKYAKMNLKINTLRLTADRIIELCVLAERRKGKEKWTKNLPPPVFPKPPEPAPPSPNAAQAVAPQMWGPSEPVGGDGISESMRQKMIKMRQERGLPVTA